jgi:3-methyladenine DNA glycosylase AlkD
MKIKEHIQEVTDHVGGIRGDIPLHRRESKRVYGFSSLPFEEQLLIWDYVWRQHAGFYYRLHAFFFLERHMKKAEQLTKMWPVIVKWQDQVNDWGLCDALAKLYTRILEVMPAEVYDRLKQWNTDEDPWKRRQSVVSLLYYSRTKKVYLSFDQVQPLIANLLGDKAYYVQKGVGWSMREVYNLYPDETFTWLKKCVKELSSIAFSTVIEKMDAKRVAQLKLIRKGTVG